MSRQDIAFLAVAAALMVAADAVWLWCMAATYGRGVERVQGSPLKVNVTAAAAAYAAMVLLLSCADRDPWKAARLGFAAYAIYNATSAAIYADFDAAVGLVDTAWGATLMFAVTLAGNAVVRAIAPV